MDTICIGLGVFALFLFFRKRNKLCEAQKAFETTCKLGDKEKQILEYLSLYPHRSKEHPQYQKLLLEYQALRHEWLQTHSYITNQKLMDHPLLRDLTAPAN